MTDLLAPRPLSYDGIERPYRVEDHIDRQQPSGRPYILVVDEQGRPTGERTTYTRVTKFIEGIEGDRRRLHDWILRQTLKGYTLSPEVYAARVAVVIGAQDERDRLNELVEEMQEFARMSERALLGTALHALTERHDLGIPTPIFPAPYRPHLQEWIRLTAPWQPFAPWQIERFVVNDQLRAAGTPDRIIPMHCQTCGTRYRIIDLKSGRVDGFTLREIEMQLATYAHSQIYDPETGERFSMDLCTCTAYVVHIPAETGEGQLLELSLTRGWELCSVLMPQIREARRYRPKPVAIDPILLQIEQAETYDQIRRIWESAVGWTTVHTGAAVARRAQLQSPPMNGGTTW